MKNLILLLFISLTSVSLGQSQQLTAIKVSSTPIDGDQFLGFDSFGYLYSIKNNVFHKVKGQENIEYKNISLGEITKVDLQNPLNIVLFYENFNTAVLVDNQLNETQKINFSENQTPIIAAAIGLASQNQLWIYNALNQQIGLFDYLKKDYKPISTPLTETIKYYHTDFNSFYWIDSKNNWYTCDIFGKTTPLGKVPDFDAIAIINDHEFIFSKDSSLVYVDLKKNSSEANYEINISEKTFKNFYYKEQILSIFTTKGITNYKIAIP